MNRSDWSGRGLGEVASFVSLSLSGPMGRAMRGMEAEDAFEVTSPTGILDYEICRVL